MKKEIKYLEKKIKSDLINKKFEDYDKDSIKFLTSIYQFETYKDFYSMNLLILYDYIEWYKENKHNEHFDKTKMYELEILKQLYSFIKEDLYNNVYYNYDYYLNKTEEKKNSNKLCYQPFYYNILNTCFDSNYFSLTMGVIFTFLYLIFTYILSLISRNCSYKNKIYEYSNNQPFITPLVNSNPYKKEDKNIDISNNILNNSSSLGSSFASLFGNSEKNILEEISDKNLFSSNENAKEKPNINVNIFDELKTQLPENLLKLLSGCDFMKMI